MKLIDFCINCTVVLCRLMSNVMKIIWKKRYKQRKLRRERNGHKILQVMLLVLEVNSNDTCTVVSSAIGTVCIKHVQPLPWGGPIAKRPLLSVCLFVHKRAVVDNRVPIKLF